MLIGQLSQATGLSREALRFYEQAGLIRAQRLANGYRSYPSETVELLRYIRIAQQLGFTLAEIGDKLPQVWQEQDTTAALDAFLVDKLQDIDQRIADLQALRLNLRQRLGTACPMRAATA